MARTKANDWRLDAARECRWLVQHGQHQSAGTHYER